MAGPLARLLAQALVIAGSVVGRAFLQAYSQAAHQAKQGGKGAAQQAAKSFRRQMSQSEALKVLNFSESSPPKSVEEVLSKYDRYFKANDPQKGGSFYLQSKIYRAKERLVDTLDQKDSGDDGRKQSNAN